MWSSFLSSIEKPEIFTPTSCLETQNGSRDIEQVENQMKLKVTYTAFDMQLSFWTLRFIIYHCTTVFQLFQVLYEHKLSSLLKVSKMNRKDENSKIESILLGWIPINFKFWIGGIFSLKIDYFSKIHD